MCKHLQDILDRVVISEISSYIPTTATSAKNQKRGRYSAGGGGGAMSVGPGRKRQNSHNDPGEKYQSDQDHKKGKNVC